MDDRIHIEICVHIFIHDFTAIDPLIASLTLARYLDNAKWTLWFAIAKTTQTRFTFRIHSQFFYVMQDRKRTERKRIGKMRYTKFKGNKHDCNCSVHMDCNLMFGTKIGFHFKVIHSTPFASTFKLKTIYLRFWEKKENLLTCISFAWIFNELI